MKMRVFLWIMFFIILCGFVGNLLLQTQQADNPEPAKVNRVTEAQNADEQPNKQGDPPDENELKQELSKRKYP